MTEKRYVEIYTLPENLYVPQLPVIIKSGILNYDIEANQTFVKLKIMGIINKAITRVKVMIQTKDENGVNNDKPILYTYENLNIYRYQEFGSKEKINIRETYTTKSFRMTVLEVGFHDGSIYKNSNHDLKPIVFEDGKYEDLWQCSCGKINYEGETECYFCHQDTQEKVLEKKAETYQRAEFLKDMKNEDSLRKAYELFVSLEGYEDSDNKAEECAKQIQAIEQKREEQKNEELYQEANRFENSEKMEDLSKAIQLYEEIRSWKDSDERYKKLNQRLEEIKARKAAEEAERKRKNKKRMMIGSGIIGIIVALAILINTVIIPSNKYKQAMSLMNEGKYFEAYEAFNELDGYKDSMEQSKIAYDNCLAIKYEEAISLMSAEEYEEAITIFEFLGDYKDSADYLIECVKNTSNFKYANIGDVITFGSYEQDNNLSNGKEEIEWIVLDKTEDKILVISKYGLDCQQYHHEWEYITWENCSLRGWLNNTFINEAFSEEEKSKIATVTVTAERNPDYNTSPGNDTQDHVFLLSINEAKKYFNSDEARKCGVTEYAIAQGAYMTDYYGTVDGKGTCVWWLRSPGFDQYDAAGVFDGGGVDSVGNYVYIDYIAVRPALWINLKS